MEVIVLDDEFNTVAIIDQFESLIWTDRYYEAGDFEIYTPATIDMLYVLRQDYYLYMAESEHLMVIETLEIITDAEDGNKLAVTGRSAESILDRRVIWQQINLKGTLQDGIRRLLNENAINPSDPNRKIPNLYFEESQDPAIKAMELNMQYLGENLYEAICDICQAYRLGFKITLNEDNQFIFKLYYGVDRTYNQIENPAVVFSANFDNLINSDYICSKRNYKTIAMIAGEGNGSSRKTTSISIDDSANSGLKRRELFTDATNMSRNSGGTTISESEYINQLQYKGLEDLCTHIISESFEGEVNENMFKYQKDYYMGDIVQVQNEYSAMSEPRIIEYVYSQSAGEIKSYPTFGYDDYNPPEN